MTGSTVVTQALEAQMRGDWAQASALYEAAMAGMREPAADVLTNYGQVLRRLGRNGEAVAAYRRATSQPGVGGASWFNLANALFDDGEWAESLAACERALQLDGTLEQAAMQRARCLVKLDRLAEAREAFAVLLKANPDNFSAWLEAGHVCKRRGTPEQMMACYRRAAAVAPSRWLGHATLAAALEAEGERDLAAVSYQRAQRADDAQPGAQAQHMVGRARLERGDAAGAIEAFGHALALVPNDFTLMLDLADGLMRVGDADGAQLLFKKVADTATEKGVLTRLAEVLFKYNFWELAEGLLRDQARSHPTEWWAHFNLGKLLVESWRMDEGLAALEHAESLAGKDLNAAQSLRAAAAGKLGDVDGCLALYRQLGLEGGPQSSYLSSAAMSALYSDTMSPQAVTDLHRDLFMPLGQGARTVFPNELSASRPLRIGYVTADLHHQHPVNLFMQPVLARHDGQQYETTIYFTGVTIDEQSRLAKSRVHRWREVSTLDDARLARLIEEDRIDVLVDLLGHTTHNRRGLFARRAAPVQATFLGYPGTTGVPNMDWIVVDKHVAPEGSEPLFTEQLARLPHCVFCYHPGDAYPQPAGFAMEDEKRPITFGSFNNITKLTPRTLLLWARLLKAVPASRLLLKAPSFMDKGAVRRFRELFAKAGVEPQRLEFRGPSGLNDMMAEYADVDIALDTFPYNGGTTSYQALWMGAPVVTLAGQGFCQRMGASILTAIGKSGWIAQTEKEYVAIAARLATERTELLYEKQTLRATMRASAALDIDTYARDLEAQYRMMWQAHVAKPEIFIAR